MIGGAQSIRAAPLSRCRLRLPLDATSPSITLPDLRILSASPFEVDAAHPALKEAPFLSSPLSAAKGNRSPAPPAQTILPLLTMRAASPPRYKMMTRLFLAFHHVRPLYIALAIAACVLTLLTVFSSADLAGGHAARRLSVGRSFALPTYFSRLYHLSTPQEPNIFHPIPAKMKAAERKFQQMINSQSRSFQQAVAEYERRYDRPPPQGFDDWYSFATANGAIIIDEYDQLEADLRPFWLLSGAEIRRRSLDVGLLPSVDLVRIQDGRTRTIDINTGFEDSEVGARARGFRLMLEKFKGALNAIVSRHAEGCAP